MLRKSAALLVLFLSVVTGSYAAINDSSTQSQDKPDIKANIQSSTSYSDVQSSGQINHDGLATDTKIENEVLNLIRNKFRKYNINITVSQGTVTLRGFVESDDVKKNLESDVNKIQGVKKVSSFIDVKKM